MELSCPEITNEFTSATQVYQHIHKQLEYLKTSRPTAVNLFEAAARFDSKMFAMQDSVSHLQLISEFKKDALDFFKQDVCDNQNIGKYGAELILSLAQKNTKDIQILTHCNTGSLATAGWGTALGIIRQVHAQKNLNHAYCTETRPVSL